MNNLNLIPAYPEIFLLIATSVILLVDIFLKDEQRVITYALSLLAIAVTALLTFTGGTGGEVVYAFNNMFVSDPLSQFLKLFTYLAVGVSLVYARQYSTDRGIINDITGGKLGGEFYVLALFCMLGQMVMISANNFLSIYMGLELMSLSLYALVALRRDNAQATEAAMKYFILGAMASGFLLYGMSMLYGATGSLELTQVIRGVASISDQTVLVFGIVFVVAGLAFKLGAVPFHMWAPDVYQGSPTGVTLLLGAAPKLATFAITYRLLVEGMLPIFQHWQQMLMVMAVLSLILGNITAIAQTNLKRMLAYSTISHMGFVLLGLLSGVSMETGLASATDAYSSALFYMVTYVLTTLGTFGVVLLLARSGFEADKIDDFKGLNKRSPWFAGLMLVMLFSMAGIPPMVGFYAKLSILQSVFAAGLPWLAVVAVLFSLIGAYYYLRVIKVMYFDEPVDNTPIVAKGDARVVLSINGLAILVLGIFPGPLLNACTYAISMTFGHLVGQ